MERVPDFRFVFRAPSTSWLACLIVLAMMAFVSAQAPPRELPPTEPLEKYDNPPAYIYRLETSPQMISVYGSFVSYQVNVDANGNNIVGDAANEPSICVDPTNRNRMAIGWRQFDTVASNFREAGWAHTTDAGIHWRFPGVLQNNVFRSDPVLNSDDAGRFFYLSLVQNFFDDMWRSLNFGQSWARLQAQGGATGGDKQWFTIDKTNSSGHGFQYQAWSTDGNNFGGRQFSRSTNGGITWMAPINIPNSPVWGTLDVDSNGNLFIGGVSNFSSPFWCVRSSNARIGNVIPIFDRVAQVNLGGSLVFSAPINPEGLVGQLFLAVDRSGTATNSNIYMLASLRPTGASNGADVMFVRSTNGGQSFSAPRRINDDPINHNKWHWFGTFSVASNGRIDAVWFDTRSAANNTNSQLFYSWSTDGGVTWSANVAVSNSFNPFLGYPNQNKIGDYITIVSDATGGNVAYAATFNGEQDIYYVRVTPGGCAGFNDVPAGSPFCPFIEELVRRGITSGCGGGNYCPSASVTRAQMAVFLLRTLEGSGYTPPPCVPGQEMFNDVPASSLFCPWIEELARRGITGGCGGGNYCPSASVTRAQMAVFLLRTLEGSGYTPPPCVPGQEMFNDVPASSLFCPWIEELARRGITGGCGGGNYCPSASVDRAQMAVFLVRTF
jgi:hypothetical protein